MTPPSFPLRRSELRRRLGIQLSHQYGLISCIKCHAICIIEHGQKTCRCKRCKKLFWLVSGSKDPIHRAIYTSDSLFLIKRIRAGIYGWLGSGHSFIPVHLFSQWEARAQLELIRSAGHSPAARDNPGRVTSVKAPGNPLAGGGLSKAPDPEPSGTGSGVQPAQNPKCSDTSPVRDPGGPAGKPQAERTLGREPCHLAGEPRAERKHRAGSH